MAFAALSRCPSPVTSPSPLGLSSSLYPCSSSAAHVTAKFPSSSAASSTVPPLSHGRSPLLRGPCLAPCTAHMAENPESVPSVSAASLSTSSKTSASSKSEEYNQVMQRQMRNPYEYHHDLGIYYTRILDNLIVGSQPQAAGDINRLYHEEGVGAILNLQQDKDIEYWEVDFASIKNRCGELGVEYMRNPARDFDPNSLRKELPKAVSMLEQGISKGLTVYVHCTAGLGRAPAVAIAYLFWFKNMNLERAYEFLTSKRPCGPRKEAVRGATYDLAKNDPWKEPFEKLPEHAFTDVADWERQLIQDRVRGLH